MTASNHDTKLPPVAYVLIAVLLWSTGGLFIKLTSLDAYQVTFFRSLLAGLTVAILTRKHGLRIDAFGVLTSIIYATLLFLFVWATKKTTAANAIFLQYTAPIYILILAPFVIGEKFHWRDLITVIFCIGGMSLFFVGKLEIADYQGNIAALFSGVFLGLYIMLLKHPRAVGRRQKAEGNETQLPASVADVSSNPARVAEASDSPPYKGGVAAASADGVVLSLPEEQHDTQSPQFEIRKPQSMNPAIAVIYGNFLLAILTVPSGVAALPVMVPLDWFSVAFLGVIQIGISYILFIRGVTGGTRPLDASIIGFIEPLLNPVWVFLFIGETPSRWAVLGGVIIISTVVSHTVIQYRNTSRQ
jgi:drug/metabolite transporter (DMT)-like permease